MARQMDEATRRARRFLADRSHADRGAHATCFCTTCVEALAKYDRQTEARVRRDHVKVVESIAQRNRDARDKARLHKRELVAECRQSDVETCAEIVRALTPRRRTTAEGRR